MDYLNTDQYLLMTFPELREKALVSLKLFNFSKYNQIEKVIYEYSKTKDDYMKNLKYFIGSVIQDQNKADLSPFSLLEKIDRRLNDIKNGKIDYNTSDIYEDSEQVFRYDIVKLLTIVKVIEGLFTCPKCHSRKVQSIEKQTRRADEPPTNFCYCTNCKNRWTE